MFLGVHISCHYNDQKYNYLLYVPIRQEVEIMIHFLHIYAVMPVPISNHIPEDSLEGVGHEDMLQ